ncbi:thermonuclease family protein [Neorhizobium tomejilense]|uniref:thermonuclease family protein n=1 Tax=Neorhizobium tomejilense TaxID=2093828 RepID=UPI003159F153
MLSETEIAEMKGRIDEVLSNEILTDWQRRFLSDIRNKISCYGIRTRLSDKQLSMLKRLTQTPTERSDLGVIADNPRPEPHPPSPRGPSRVQRPHRNPFRVSNPFRPRYLLRPPRAFRSVPTLGRGLTLASLAMVMIVGFIGSFLAPDATTGDTALKNSIVAPQPKASATRGRSSFSITDGDTIRLDDGTRVRLVGFNTPEKFEPQCPREAALGNRATERLRELVATATSTDVKLVACACAPGTEGTKKCNHGRSCGTLKVNGRDVGQTLISEGLAVPFVCGANGCPPTPRPWCR